MKDDSYTFVLVAVAVMLYMLLSGYVSGKSHNQKIERQCLLHQEMEVNGTRFRCEVLQESRDE